MSGTCLLVLAGFGFVGWAPAKFLPHAVIGGHRLTAQFSGRPQAPRCRANAKKRRNITSCSFEDLRREIREAGFPSKEEWDQFVAEGAPWYIPTQPDVMFAAEWQGWDDFLGCDERPSSEPSRAHEGVKEMVQYTEPLVHQDDDELLYAPREWIQAWHERNKEQRN
mmetsp:Transcript_62426/g.140732  ORF Transcript_62426/g.140732 Transcript_62426/m.140732 type:complete len:166 (-) Transcript_62426:28-525(-)